MLSFPDEQPMVNPSATQPVPIDPPTERRGCSCIGTLVFLAAFVLVASVLAYMSAERYTRTQAFKGLSPAEVTEFNEWLHKPIAVPTDWYRERPPLPKHLAELRTRFFNDVDPVRPRVQRLFYPRATTRATSVAHFKATALPSVYEKLVNGQPLDTAETSAVLGLTQSIKPLADQAQQLIAHPNYLINDRGLLDRYIMHWPGACAEVFSPYILGCAYAGDWDTAIIAHAAVGQLVRRDPEFLINHTFADQFVRTSEGLARQTSDTAQLKELLQVMINYRALVLQSSAPLDHPLSGFYKIGCEMAEDGFIREAPSTRLDYFRAWLLYSDYLKWLRRLPPSDRRSEQARNAEWEDDEYGYILPFHEPLEPVNIGILKPLVRHVSLNLGTAGLVSTYSDAKVVNGKRKHSVAGYDLFCLHLAQRIATLDGLPLPTTAEALVPAYLPEFPSDPFTSAPVQLDPSTKRFYSAGPDKSPATADDIISLADKYDHVDKKNGYR